MSTTNAGTEVNSQSWWDDYFSGQWDANNGRAQTTHFMQRLVENLPQPEREFLATEKPSVLDWGCALGNGVDVLAKAFPSCRVVGMDFAERAIAEARKCFPKYEFRHTQQGEINDHFDVIVTSNCLEHFADPLAVMRQHLRSCRQFYVALVPYQEAPLCSSHVSQFREECFPEQLEGFTRLATAIVDCDPPYWSGKQILVIYASQAYIGRRRQYALHAQERQKWSDFYATLPLHEMDNSVRLFGEELAANLHELLPAGSSVLEAGCGAGWQSMVLAESGRLRVTLMDFAPEAIHYAQRAFAQRDLPANFVCQDVFRPGEPEYDLVFNAGVLEHYTLDEQAEFLRGMASRSRKYVLALVPNRHCYWYWIWRIYHAGRGGWPYGKEVPMGNLSAAFERAGLNFLGQWHGGSAWSEDFLNQLPGLNDELREHLLAVHRSGIIPERERGYLVAALGCKGEAPSLPSCWHKPAGRESFSADEIAATLADTLALGIAAEQRHKRIENELTQKDADQNRRLVAAEQAHATTEKKLQNVNNEAARLGSELARLGSELARKDRQLQSLEPIAASALRDSQVAAELAALKASRGYRMLQRLWRVRERLAPHGSRRERWARSGLRALCGAPRLARTCYASIVVRPLRRAAVKLAPADTAHGRWARSTVRKVRRLRYDGSHQPPLDFDQILAENTDRKGIVVYPPFIDWTWMRQRPHQLMAQFARAGYLSFFCSPKCRTDTFQGFVRVAERLYLCDTLAPLQDIPDCLLLLGWTGHWETARQFKSPKVIYDYLDDLGVSSEGGVPDRHKLELHHKLVAQSEIVLATARRLHDEVKRIRTDAVYCPNGVDYEHFHCASAPPVPADIADLVATGRPIIGYYGALARWFDYELVARAAAARKDCEFLLIGPDFDSTMSRQNLTSLPNVRWLGEKKYDELPAYLYYFTVATIPFVVNEITKATSPVKLFEYMAGGKPIVTTDLPECREYACVLAARDAAEYIVMLDEAIHRGRMDSYRRLLDKEARNNTWEARVRQIILQAEVVCAREMLRSA